MSGRADAGGELSFRAVMEAIKDPVVVWSCVRDDHGDVVDFRYEHVNSAAERTIGVTREDLVGRRLLDVLPAHRELGLFDRYRTVALTGEPTVIDIPWFEDGNVAGAFEASVAPLGAGIVSVARDVTDRVRAEAALAESERTARFLADNATDALLRLDGHRRVVFASEATSALLEFRPGDLVGAPFLELFVEEDRDDVAAAIEEAVERGIGVAREVRALTAAHDGRAWVEVTPRAVVVPAQDGYVVEFHVTMQDARERRDARLALAASERRMRTLVTSAPVGIFEVDLQRGFTFVNQRYVEIAGWSTTEEGLGHSWRGLVGEAMTEDLAAHWLETVAAGRDYDRELRFRRPDGREVCVHAHAVPVTDDSGRITSYLGTVDDITERRELEQARFQAAELFTTAFDNAPTGMMLTSIDGFAPPRVLKANDAYVQMTGRTFEETVGLDMYSITHPDDVEAVRAGRLALIAGELDSHWMEARQRDGSGRWRWYSITRSAVRDADGALRFMIAQLQDVTDRKEAEEHARRLAVTDPLTGLANRRHFMDRLAEAVDGGPGRNRGEKRLAVAFIDLDHFKTVNDVLGHEAGDVLLEEVAGALVRAVRPGDTVARLGGDEFSVVFADVTDEELAHIADRLHHVIDIERVLPDGSIHHVTASIGVAIADPTASPDAAELLRRADEAMYRAKQDGRHGWVIATPPAAA